MKLDRINALPSILFPEASDPEVHAALIRARDWLLSHEWTRGWGAPGSGCLLHAIAAAYGTDDFMFQGDLRTMACIRAMRFESPRAAYQWNDSPTRNKEAVLARFQRAIDKTAPRRRFRSLLPARLPSSHEFELEA